MPLSKTYNILLGPKHDMFGVVQGTPHDAIAVLDNANSSFKLSTISHEETNTFIKKITSIDSSARKTRIVTNTADIQMSDIMNASGEPLYYKVLKEVGLQFNKTIINGMEPEAEDANFYYLNKREASIEYYMNDDIVFARDFEVYPVFIWQEYSNLAPIMALDNKHYYYRGSRGRVIVTASKPNVQASASNEPVFKLNRIKFNKVSMSPFLVRTLKSGQDNRVSFIYDYLMTKPDHETVFSEQVVINSEGVIVLNNANVFKDSVYIQKKVERKQERVADNSKGLLDGLINSTKGEIDITSLLEDGLIDYGDYIYIEYKYVRTTNEVVVDPRNFELKNMVAHFRIGPTKVKKTGVSLDIEPQITYTLTDDDGTLLLDDQQASDYFHLDLHKGWGEDGYGDNGFSGTVDDYSSLVIRRIGGLERSVIQEDVTEEERGPETGYGESGYSLGPFGGSYLLSIEEIKRLLDIKNNTEAATITIGNISYYSDIQEVHAYARDSIALPKSEARAIRESVYANSIVVFDSTSREFKSMGIDKYESQSGVHFRSTWIEVTDTGILLEFDISSLSHYTLPTGEIDDDFILTGTIDQSANAMANRFSSLYSSEELVITDLALFTMDTSTNEITFLSHDLFISSDFLTVNAEVATSVMNVGLGLRKNDTYVYPLIFLNLEKSS